MSNGRRLVEACVAGDFDEAGALLAPAVSFKALLPSRVREAATRDEAVDILRRWFDDAEELVSIETGEVIDRRHVGYRVRWYTPEEGPHVFEQHAYYEDGPDGIAWMHVVCSGDRPLR